MILEELAAYLVSHGFGTMGVDLFLHVAPDKPDDLVVLIEYAGDEPLWVQEGPKVDLERPRVQLAARSVRPEVCRARAEAGYQLLMAIHNLVIDGTRILWCNPSDAPAMAGRDENGRFLTTVNFRVTKELSIGT